MVSFQEKILWADPYGATHILGTLKALTIVAILQEFYSKEALWIGDVPIFLFFLVDLSHFIDLSYTV